MISDKLSLVVVSVEVSVIPVVGVIVTNRVESCPFVAVTVLDTTATKVGVAVVFESPIWVVIEVCVVDGSHKHRSLVRSRTIRCVNAYGIIDVNSIRARGGHTASNLGDSCRLWIRGAIAAILQR
jgi:hypothetical protein